MFIAQGAPTLRSGGVRCAGRSTTDFGSIVLFSIGHGTPTERDLGGDLSAINIALLRSEEITFAI